MKKLKLLLASLLILVALFGCATSNSSETNDNTNTESSEATNNQETSSNTLSATLEEQEIFNQNDIIVTATDLVDDSIWGQTIQVLIENNSSSDVVVTAGAMAVNGYMITDLIYETVTAGAKSYATLYCLSSELENAGITAIEDVDIWFNLVDPNSYQTIYSSETPSTVKTSLSGSNSTTPNFDGQEIYNENGVVVYAAYTNESSIWGESILFLVENNSGNDIVISSENTSINGFMINSYMYADVKSGYKSFDDMTIFESDLEDNKIDNIENIKFQLSCYDSNSFRSLFETDYIELNVGN